MCCHKEIEIKHKSEVVSQREALGDGAEPAELIPESEAIATGFGSLAFPTSTLYQNTLSRKMKHLNITKSLSSELQVKTTLTPI